jgi:hypothetical protein
LEQNRRGLLFILELLRGTRDVKNSSPFFPAVAVFLTDVVVHLFFLVAGNLHQPLLLVTKDPWVST